MAPLLVDQRLDCLHLLRKKIGNTISITRSSFSNICIYYILLLQRIRFNIFYGMLPRSGCLILKSSKAKRTEYILLHTLFFCGKIPNYVQIIRLPALVDVFFKDQISDLPETAVSAFSQSDIRTAIPHGGMRVWRSKAKAAGLHSGQIVYIITYIGTFFKFDSMFIANSPKYLKLVVFPP